MTYITLDAIKAEQSRIADLISLFESQTKIIQTVNIPEVNIDLRNDEHYAGAVFDGNGNPTHHLILLPIHAKSITWPEALIWAEQAGVELPTRQEQALLYANLKPHFKGAWYWSSEQHAKRGARAWRQHFNDGYQDDGHKDEKDYARAIRRVPITQDRHGHHR